VRCLHCQYVEKSSQGRGNSLQNQAKETFPEKREPFPPDNVMKQIPSTFSVEENQYKSSHRGAVCSAPENICCDYFLCFLLCKLVKSFVYAQSSLSAILGPYFKELPSLFMTFEVLTVALLCIQVFWKVMLCCCVSDSRHFEEL
jgi:hypothetical protein